MYSAEASLDEYLLVKAQLRNRYNTSISSLRLLGVGTPIRYAEKHTKLLKLMREFSREQVMHR